LTGEFPGLCASAGDDVMRLSRRSSLRGVIGLTEFESKSLYEVGACAQKDAWGAIFERNCDEGGPAGMGAKPEGGMLHKTPQGYPSLRRT
jgi:hypothetical protein